MRRQAGSLAQDEALEEPRRVRQVPLGRAGLRHRLDHEIFAFERRTKRHGLLPDRPVGIVVHALSSCRNPEATSVVACMDCFPIAPARSRPGFDQGLWKAPAAAVRTGLNCLPIEIGSKAAGLSLSAVTPRSRQNATDSAATTAKRGKRFLSERGDRSKKMVAAMLTVKEQFMGKPYRKDDNPANRDLIAGKPGSHPACGHRGRGRSRRRCRCSLIGSAGGPAGTAIGAAVGAVAGGLAGHAAGEAVNPTLEDIYWRQAHIREPYYHKDFTYNDYGPAYRTGWEAADCHWGQNRRFEDVEPELRGEYERMKGASRLTWDRAKVAARAAWTASSGQCRATSTGRSIVNCKPAQGVESGPAASAAGPAFCGAQTARRG